MDIQELYVKLKEKLLSHGFVLQVYESITTDSYYIKLDYGVMKTIRISDHHGKRHLNYRYNIGPHIPKEKYDRKSKRFYYNTDDFESLLLQILSDHTDKLTHYGSKYQEYMEQNIQSMSGNRGFWKNATTIEP